jgi:hypothetical protein
MKEEWYIYWREPGDAWRRMDNRARTERTARTLATFAAIRCGGGYEVLASPSYPRVYPVPEVA